MKALKPKDQISLKGLGAPGLDSDKTRKKFGKQSKMTFAQALKNRVTDKVKS